MAYSELIKDFGRIRAYMREFHVYGFRRRGEYHEKSARSYDNERRRIESWLGECMFFRRNAAGKNVFLSVDSRRIPHNPLYRAFKAKSFTDRDITLHFYILDALAGGAALTAGELVGRMEADYLAQFDGAFSPDESTVRKKLREYTALGLLCAEKQGRQVYYRRTDGAPFDLASWAGALAFFSEADPLGVVGSFLLDKLPPGADLFRFKHHYILHALDSEILYALLEAIGARQNVALTGKNLRGAHTVCPLKLYISTQTGRQYLLGRDRDAGRMLFFRLDAIEKVLPGGAEPRFEAFAREAEAFGRHLWGVAVRGTPGLDHLEMTVRVQPGEEYVLRRLEREKRGGRVERLDALTARFTADVYDAMEMLPWLRTFLGRIASLQCSDGRVTRRFYEDLARMEALYGGDGDAVQ